MNSLYKNIPTISHDFLSIPSSSERTVAMAVSNLCWSTSSASVLILGPVNVFCKKNNRMYCSLVSVKMFHLDNQVQWKLLLTVKLVIEELSPFGSINIIISVIFKECLFFRNCIKILFRIGMVGLPMEMKYQLIYTISILFIHLSL